MATTSRRDWEGRGGLQRSATAVLSSKRVDFRNADVVAIANFAARNVSRNGSGRIQTQRFDRLSSRAVDPCCTQLFAAHSCLLHTIVCYVHIGKTKPTARFKPTRQEKQHVSHKRACPHQVRSLKLRECFAGRENRSKLTQPTFLNPAAGLTQESVGVLGFQRVPDLRTGDQLVVKDQLGVCSGHAPLAPRASAPWPCSRAMM